MVEFYKFIRNPFNCCYPIFRISQFNYILDLKAVFVEKDYPC